MAQDTIEVLKVLLPKKVLINEKSWKYEKRFWKIFEEKLYCYLLVRNFLGFALIYDKWPISEAGESASRHQGIKSCISGENVDGIKILKCPTGTVEYYQI